MKKAILALMGLAVLIFIANGAVAHCGKCNMDGAPAAQSSGGCKSMPSDSGKTGCGMMNKGCCCGDKPCCDKCGKEGMCSAGKPCCDKCGMGEMKKCGMTGKGCCCGDKPCCDKCGKEGMCSAGKPCCDKCGMGGTKCGMMGEKKCGMMGKDCTCMGPDGKCTGKCRTEGGCGCECCKKMGCGASGASDAKPAAANEVTLDPVCGMEVAAGSKNQFTYEGKVYNFCCESCKERFSKDPMKFLNK